MDGREHQATNSDPIKIALLSFSSYDDWWEVVRKETRHHVRAALKAGVTVETVPSVVDERTAAEVVRMYNEAPFRENRYFAGYRQWDVARVQRHYVTDENSISLIAKWRGRVIGIWMSKFAGQTGIMASAVTSLETRRQVRGVAICWSPSRSNY